jgi:hypothetical protein
MEQPNPQPEPQNTRETARHPELPPPFEVLPYKPGMPPLTRLTTENEGPHRSRGSKLKLKLILGILLSAVGSWAVLHFKLYKIGRYSEDVTHVNHIGHTQPHAIQKKKDTPVKPTPSTLKKSSKKTSSSKATAPKTKRKPWLAH